MYIKIRSNGLFYDTLDDDAYIIHNIFGYSISKTKRCSFPNKSLNKVTNILDGKKINYIVMDSDGQEEKHDFDNLNSYDKYLDKAKKHYNKEIKIDDIINKIDKLSDEELDNLVNLVEKYINEK